MLTLREMCYLRYEVKPYTLSRRYLMRKAKSDIVRFDVFLIYLPHKQAHSVPANFCLRRLVFHFIILSPPHILGLLFCNMLLKQYLRYLYGLLGEEEYELHILCGYSRMKLVFNINVVYLSATFSADFYETVLGLIVVGRDAIESEPNGQRRSGRLKSIYFHVFAPTCRACPLTMQILHFQDHTSFTSVIKI